MTSTIHRDRWGRRLRACSLGAALAVGLVSAGLGTRAAEAPLADGDVLLADQIPRFLQPIQQDSFGFDPIVIVGDHAVVTFERPDASEESGVAAEIWDRTETDVVRGRSVSLFRPSWSADQLRAALRLTRWGVDRPFLHWGDLVLPGGSRQPIHLRLAPTGLPRADVAVVSETVQYTSHAVNLWIPDFGDERIEVGRDEWDVSGVTRRFYDHFADEYETLAIVTQTMHPMPALHRNVQNPVAGLGLPLFDESATYGSGSVLQGVEVYGDAQWADAPTVLHQQAHQWSDYTGAWARAGIARQGHDPERHTPLLTPGAVMAGAVLEGTRQVVTVSDGAEVARTEPTVSYSPLTLYRMGLIAPGELPAYEVFEQQGQFDPEGRAAPAVGTSVVGSRVTVTADDFIAADGVRNGPVVDRVRRALVYVSRSGLASAEEMDVVTYFAARLGADDGVTTWDGFPSFFEATGERASMETTIRLAAGQDLPVLSGPADVSDPEVPVDVLVGIELDQPVPGRIGVGQPIDLDGRLTLTDRTDYNIVCFRWIRYGAADVNEIFVCGTLEARRFSVPVTFVQGQQGRYTLEVFAFWTDSGPQAALSRYGVIVVE